MRLILGLMLTASVFVGIAAAAPGCTIKGTQGRDILAGGSAPDVVCALPANDYVSGGDGDDVLRGGSSNDVLVGNQGADRLLGKGGNDRLFAVDRRPTDSLDGGDGFDQCFVDQGDHVRRCEKVFTGDSPAGVAALSHSFHGALVLAEEQTPSPGIQTVTVTVTVTAGPQCVSPPASPPPSC